MNIIITENKLHDVVIKFLNKEFGDLRSYKTDKYPGYVFYMKGNDILFEYNKKNGIINIDYKRIWSLLDRVFGMEYEQIQEVTKKWLEEHYNLRVTTTKTLIFLKKKLVGGTLQFEGNHNQSKFSGCC
jgi:hypothetical protein